MRENEENVGLGEVKYGQAPLILKAVALGSCVGVALIDYKRKKGGIAHIMLPNSTNYTEANKTPGKFADTGIKLLLQKLQEQGSNPQDLEAKIAGGAKMFNFQGSKTPVSDIGNRNIESVRKILHELGIKITGEAVGGDYGRTMILDLNTLTVTVTSLSKKENITL